MGANFIPGKCRNENNIKKMSTPNLTFTQEIKRVVPHKLLANMAWLVRNHDG
jgi:hypothetical protein